MKKVTFDALREHVYKIIDRRLEYLGKISSAASKKSEKLVDFIRGEAGTAFQSENQMYGLRHVKDFTKTFNNDSCKLIKDKIDAELKEGDEKMSMNDTYIILNEIEGCRYITI